MTSRIRIISDAPLVIFASIFFLITLVGCIMAIWLVGQPGVAADSNEIIPIQIIFVLLLFCLSLGLIIAMSEAVSFLTLSHDAITIQTAFTKKQSFSYKNFPFVYHGKYFHGNVFGDGVMMHYIVFSQRRIPKETLCTINKLKCTHDAFKIRYTKNTYEKLCRVVPFDVRRKLDSALSELNPR